MAILIQKLTNVINIIETTRAAGEQIINSLGVDCVAKVQHKLDHVNGKKDKYLFWETCPCRKYGLPPGSSSFPWT